MFAPANGCLAIEFGFLEFDQFPAGKLFQQGLAAEDGQLSGRPVIPFAEVMTGEEASLSEGAADTGPELRVGGRFAER
ncbi:hypothetical protein D3C81_1770670 [compost metagenome]